MTEPGAAGILSMVGTPIGNLSDASPRVRDVLSRADVVLCEDTRVTGKLLSAFDIHVSLQRCDENVMSERIAPTLERMTAYLERVRPSAVLSYHQAYDVVDITHPTSRPAGR